MDVTDVQAKANLIGDAIENIGGRGFTIIARRVRELGKLPSQSFPPLLYDRISLAGNREGVSAPESVDRFLASLRMILHTIHGEAVDPKEWLEAAAIQARALEAPPAK